MILDLDLDPDPEILFNNLNNKINKFIKNKKSQEVTNDDLEIYDLIHIYFHPYSQRYIYELIPKIGFVISIEEYIY